jgi:type II secretory pathway pseudopilin PulG
MPFYRVPHWMNLNTFSFVLWVLGALGTPTLARAQNTQQEARRTGQTAQVEEVYIARFVLESSSVPTDFCAPAKTGFNAHFEVQFTLRSTTTRPSDGRMLDTNVKTIGSAHGCSGRTADQATFKFYLEMLLGSRALNWIGDCAQTKFGFPEKGVGIVHCAFNLSDPLGPYIGGQLTTNSFTSRKSLGLESDPPGYTQTSIAAIRLWKRRVER